MNLRGDAPGLAIGLHFLRIDELAPDMGYAR
jgi:hypothetical protein